VASAVGPLRRLAPVTRYLQYPAAGAWAPCRPGMTGTGRLAGACGRPAQPRQAARANCCRCVPMPDAQGTRARSARTRQAGPPSRAAQGRLRRGGLAQAPGRRPTLVQTGAPGAQAPASMYYKNWFRRAGRAQMKLGKLAAHRCRPYWEPPLLASPQYGWPLWGSPLRFATVGRETGAWDLLHRSQVAVTGAPGPPAGPPCFVGPDGPQGSCERRQSRAPHVRREHAPPLWRVTRRDTWCMQGATSATVFPVHCERRLAPGGPRPRPALTRRGRLAGASARPRAGAPAGHCTSPCRARLHDRHAPAKRSGCSSHAAGARAQGGEHARRMASRPLVAGAWPLAAGARQCPRWNGLAACRCTVRLHAALWAGCCTLQAAGLFAPARRREGARRMSQASAAAQRSTRRTRGTEPLGAFDTVMEEQPERGVAWRLCVQ
jgi:hypothetical protein